MKYLKLMILFGLIAFIPVMSGCATTYPYGIFYTEMKLPVAVGAVSGSSSLKSGTAEAKSILGMIAIGDCSIYSAMKNGEITKIHYVDWEVKNTLGIGHYKVTVYGE